MSAGISLGTIASVVGIAAGVNSIVNSGGGGGGGGSVGGGSGTGAQEAADPFAPYRANLGGLYAGALQTGNKVDITKMPGYSQFESGVLDPALEASKRSSAASGMLRSGNEQIALESTAQKGYYGFMTDYLNRLAQGSGAVNNPATAAALGVNQGNLNDAAFMQGLGAVSTGLKGLYGSSGGGYNPADTSYMPVSTFNGSGDASWMSDPWM